MSKKKYGKQLSFPLDGQVDRGRQTDTHTVETKSQVTDLNALRFDRHATKVLEHVVRSGYIKTAKNA